MRSRWPVAVGVVLLGVSVAGAQPQPPIPPPALPLPLPAIPTVPPTPPPAASQLPPLLPPPPSTPLPEVPRPGTGPATEYDPGYLYLPERAPERPRRVEDCGPGGRWWAAPSFELAWVPASRAPTNVRLRLPDGMGSSIPGPVLPVAGRSSGRFDAALGLVLGRWFGESNTEGVEASFFVRNSDHTFGATAPDMLVLFPQGPGRGVPQVLAIPPQDGQRFVSTFPATLSTFFTTVDVNYRHKLLCTDSGRLDALVGYRFAYLQDELYLGEVPDDGRDDYKRNRASVSNPFHGGQVGLAGEYRADGWYVAGTAKVAFGVVTPEVTTSGLFVGAQGRTGNRFTRLQALNWSEESEFAVMPTLNLSVGRQLSAHSRVFAGYSFQYLSRVARLGDALDARNSGVTFTDFWVQSVNLGFEWRY